MGGTPFDITKPLGRDPIECPATVGVSLGGHWVNVIILRGVACCEVHTGAEGYCSAGNRISGRIDHTPMHHRTSDQPNCVRIGNGFSAVGLPAQTNISITFDMGQNPIHANVIGIKRRNTAAVLYADLFLDQRLRAPLPTAKRNYLVWNWRAGDSIQKK